MQQSLFAMALAEPAEQPKQQALDTPLSDVVFTVIDVETTGLSAKKNSLTEVVAIQFKNGQELEKFSTLVKPTEDITAESEAITGITADMVKDAPALITVLTDLCSFVGAAPILVGHNVGFDVNFIREKVGSVGLNSFVDRFELSRSFCTKALAVKAIPGLPSYDGVTVASSCNVYNPNPHRAEYDVRMCAGILFAVIERLRKEGVPMNTLQDLFNYQGSLEK